MSVWMAVVWERGRMRMGAHLRQLSSGACVVAWDSERASCTQARPTARQSSPASHLSLRFSTPFLNNCSLTMPDERTV